MGHSDRGGLRVSNPDPVPPAVLAAVLGIPAHGSGPGFGLRGRSGTALSYYDFPREHRTRIRTNNALERIMKEIRRRTRVVGAFPDGHSALMLCATRLWHIAGTQWGSRRYLNMDLLREQDLELTIAAEAS